MPRCAGDKLGPYEILALIGKGGMGEVYRAHDTKLKRDVALKVLPAAFSRDPDRMARFQREAEVLASLNHPNIAAIHGVEDSALVMELVEGESPKGPLRFDEAWSIASQIAAALEYAHEKGVVHRDLKPANIRVTPEGVVKLLDFGLAKAFTNNRGDVAPASAGDKAENSPTLTIGATEVGVILGTAAYMPPEQAKGKMVGKRADIWSFGVVLYELLTGERLFKGESVAETLTQVLTKEPDLSKVPVKARKLLSRCLEKDPAKRLRDIGEAAYLLQDTPTITSSRPQRAWLAWLAAGIFFIAAAILAFVHFGEAATPEHSLRVQIPMPSRFPIASHRISPDGRYLVFAGPNGSGQPLWVRPLNSLAAEPLSGTEGATYPFWSPDSKSIGFFAGGKLKRVDVTGGSAHTLGDASFAGGGAWSQTAGDETGIILFSPDNGPILRVSAAGGTPTPATKMHPGDVGQRFPWFLPDGRHFYYSAIHEVNGEKNTVRVGDLSSAEDRVIGEADSQALYSQGFLLFSRQQTLLAQPFDTRRSVATGEALPLERQIQRVVYTPYADFSASVNGLLSVRTGSVNDSLQLTWVDRNGKQLGQLGEPGKIDNFQISPDGKSVANGLYPDGTTDNSVIWIYDAADGRRTRFTFDPAFDTNPVWSPDGRSIIFGSRRKGHLDLYRKSSDGAGTEELLYSDERDKYPTSWSPDGKFLLCRRIGANGEVSNVWVLPLTPERPGAPLTPFPFAPLPFSAGNAQFSPDGGWIAYASLESQRSEVYVARFPGAGGKRQISVAGGITPRWRRDGKEIYYMTPDGTIMSAAVATKGDALEVGQVRRLFGPVNIAGTSFRYDVAPDGQRFLIVPPPQASTEGVTVVQNWVAGLKK